MPDQTIPLGSEEYGADFRLRLVGALAIAADTHQLLDRHSQMRRAQVIEHLATAAAGIAYPEFYRWADASGSSDRSAVARVTAMVQHLHNEAACAQADGYEATALGIEGSARRIAWALEGGTPTPATQATEPTSDADHFEEAVKASTAFPCSSELLEDVRPMREYEARLETDARRSGRRDAIRLLLECATSAGRGHLTDAEAAKLIHYVGDEMREADATRDVAEDLRAFIEHGFDTHMQFSVIRPDGSTEQLPCADWCQACKLQRAEQAAEAPQGAIEQVRALVAGIARPASAGITEYDRGRQEMATAVALAITEQPTTEGN